MADENKKQLAKTESAITPNTADVAEPKPKSRFLFYLLFLLVVVLFSVTGAGGYYLWQQQLTMQDLQASQINDVRNQIGGLQQTTRGQASAIEASNSQIKGLHNQQQQIAEISQKAIDITNRQQKDWKLAEIDYLLRLANRRLQISRDINSAIAAMQAADQGLHDLSDLSLFNIRQQLSKDIGNLKALHQVDVNGTAMALDQMLVHLSELPYKSVVDEVKTQLTTDPKTDAQNAEESGFVDSVLSTVMKIGDIKIHDRSIEPASSRQQQQYIEQLLRTYLLGARLAVLRFDQTQYIHDLDQAQNLLHAHYKASDNRVNQMQSDLASFASINLTPDLPSINQSWNLLQEVMRDIQSKKDANQQTEPSIINKTTQEAR
ncbi:MAG: uroporphyrinogen-III C-methyltransferase [Gammaproteobacteria bacterium]|nr:uroporphyrinogen-III C-methyltransferase [Gammaproteobacteria bacterium]